MRIVVIGGTGHIGSYLVPRLVGRGHDIVCVSRRLRQPYFPDERWEMVEHAVSDRAAEEEHGQFGERIVALRPNVVIDLTCYTPDSAVQLSNALAGRIDHLIHCGTIWVHGPSVEVPTTEDAPRRPFGDYGCRKAIIERYLLDQAAAGRLPATVLHPGHLVGSGWSPINPAGNFNPQVFDDLAHERPVRLPNFGLETLHHVHAGDVAQAFERAVEHRDAAIGESFHVVSPAALTFRGYAEGVAAWYGFEARLEFLPYEEWRVGASDRDASVTLDHLRHSPNCSIAKARSRLNYAPRYSSLAAVQDALRPTSMRASLPCDNHDLYTNSQQEEGMTMPITMPDLSARPFQLVAERAMDATPDVLFCAWTEQMDRWFAAPGSVLMKPEVNGVFSWETDFAGKRHPHYGRFLRLERNRLVELTWVTSATKGAETVVTVEFEPRASGTAVRLVHRGFPDDESRKQHDEAWPKVLAQLEERIRIHA